MELAQIDLNLLVSLDALLRERNVSRAAKRVALSQPAMSIQLRQLRGIFGDELLVRVGREYQLTPLAEHLVEPLQDVLRNIEQMVEYRPEFAPETDRRVFRIGTNDALEYLLIKPLLESIEVDAPGISLEVQPLFGGLTFDMLEAGELELGLYPLGHFDTHLEQQLLYEDRWVCVAWSKSAAVPDTITFEEFNASPNAIFNWAWYDRSRQLKVDYKFLEDLPVRIADNSHFLRLFLLKRTNIVSLTYEKLARAVCKEASLRLIQPSFEVAPIEVGNAVGSAVYHRSGALLAPGATRGHRGPHLVESASFPDPPHNETSSRWQRGRSAILID